MVNKYIFKDGYYSLDIHEEKCDIIFDPNDEPIAVYVNEYSSLYEDEDGANLRHAVCLAHMQKQQICPDIIFERTYNHMSWRCFYTGKD